jgi:hypothetical protein
MTSLSLFTGGTLLRAAAADAPDDRIREGILVPWDEPGRTHLGRGLKVRRAFAASLRPDAKVVGVYGHNRRADNGELIEAPAVSRLLAWEDRPEGLWGRIRIGRGPLGDQLLAEIDDGIRDGLSVEIGELGVDSEGHVVAGELDFFAHVPVGAYDSARALALAAALHNPTDTGDSVTAPTDAPAPAEPTTPAAPAIDYDALAGAMLKASAATVPGGLNFTGLAPSTPAKTDGEGDPIRKAAELQAAVFQGNTRPELRAALADITNTGLDLFQNPAGSLGEKLWEGTDTTRPFVDLLRKRPLTSWKYKSWQWVNRPRVAAYAGDKVEIPTNTVSVEQFENEATRVAGGWDIDRKFRDFGDAEFWEEFYRAGVESYLEVTNEQAVAALVSFARDITVDANVPTAYAGINVAQADILRAAALGTAILEDTPRVKKGPDYVIVNTTDWLGLMDLTNLDLPAFLALLKVRPEGFMRSSLVPSGSIIMGVTQAATFRELGGASPIRVEALDVAHAGIDSALYGYTGISHDRPGGIIEVPLTVGA